MKKKLFSLLSPNTCTSTGTVISFFSLICLSTGPCILRAEDAGVRAPNSQVCSITFISACHLLHHVWMNVIVYDEYSIIKFCILITA